MGIWSSVAKERNQIDEFRGLIEDLREDFAENCQDLKVCHERHFERLGTVFESQKEALQRIEEVMCDIQQRLNSQVVSSVGSVVDNDNRENANLL